MQVLDLEDHKLHAWRLAMDIMALFVPPNATKDELSILLSASNIIRTGILKKLQEADGLFLLYDPINLIKELNEFIEQSDDGEDFPST